MPTSAPICADDFLYSATRGCCEWSLSPASCPPGNHQLGWTGSACNNDNELVDTNLYPYNGFGFLVEANWSNADHDFDVMWGGSVDSVGGSFDHNGGIQYKRDGVFTAKDFYTLMNEMCRLTYSTLPTPEEKISDAAIIFDGCTCKKFFPTSYPGNPSFGQTVTVDESYVNDPFNYPTGDNHTYIYPTPYFGTQTVYSTFFGKNCIRENEVWVCPEKYENPVDAGEDTAYKAGPSGACTPVCGTLSCPPGYTFDPILDLCVSDPGGQYRTLDQELEGGWKRTLALVSATTGALKVYEYTDAEPPVLLEIDEVLSSGVLTARLHADSAGTYHLTYTPDAITVLYRKSQDGGRTWGTAVTLYSAYVVMCAITNKIGGGWIYILFEEATEKLFVATAEADAGGAPVSPNTPVQVVASGAYPSADLVQDGAGRLYLAYTTTAGSVVNLTCKSLTGAGVGTWS